MGARRRGRGLPDRLRPGAVRGPADDARLSARHHGGHPPRRCRIPLGARPPLLGPGPVEPARPSRGVHRVSLSHRELRAPARGRAAHRPGADLGLPPAHRGAAGNRVARAVVPRSRRRAAAAARRGGGRARRRAGARVRVRAPGLDQGDHAPAAAAPARGGDRAVPQADGGRLARCHPAHRGGRRGRRDDRRVLRPVVRTDRARLPRDRRSGRASRAPAAGDADPHRRGVRGRPRRARAPHAPLAVVLSRDHRATCRRRTPSRPPTRATSPSR